MPELVLVRELLEQVLAQRAVETVSRVGPEVHLQANAQVVAVAAEGAEPHKAAVVVLAAQVQD